METNNSFSDIVNGSVDRISAGLQRMENTQIQESNKHLKLPPKYFEISWQTYRIAAFILFVLACAVMKYIVDYFSETIDDTELINILKIISFFFVLNFGTFLFITVFYKYRKSVKGAKGEKGRVGKRGHQGSPSYCNICEKKTGGFKRELKNKPMKEEVVPSLLLNFSKNTKPYWRIMQHRINISGKHYRLMTPSYLGPGKPENANLEGPITYPNMSKIENIFRQPISQSDPFVNQIKPIIGVSASFNRNTGELYSILFFKDKNKFHNPRRYKYTPLGNTFGKQKKMGIGVEFKCPSNTAIYKIELFHNSSMIVGLRIYSANVETGEHIHVIDPFSNKKRKYATIGRPISKNDITFTKEVVEAGHFLAKKRMFQSFISQVSAYVDRDTKQIYSLGFLNASIYVDGFEIS